MSDPASMFDTPDRSLPRRVWDHMHPWSWRRAWNLVCHVLAAVPGVRRYVLFTTPIKDHPMKERYERAAVEAYAARMDRAGCLIADHPAGCFYGSFAAAYPDVWHIPYNAECELPHGPDPIRLEGPSCSAPHGKQGGDE